MCELMAMCFARPLYADFSIRAFAMRDEENADGWGLAWYPDQSLAIAKEPLTWRQSGYAEFLQTYAHLCSNIYVGHVRKKTMGGENTRADSHPFSRELDGVEYCFAHNGTIRTAWTEFASQRYRPIGDTDSEQIFCHIMEELAQRPADGPAVDPSRMGRLFKGSRDRGTRGVDRTTRLASAEAQQWLHRKAIEINRHGKFNMMISDGERLFCYHDFNGFKGLWLWMVPVNSHRVAHHLDDPAMHVDFETEPENIGVLISTVPLNRQPGWRRFEPGEMIGVERGRITYAERGSRHAVRPSS